MTSPTIAEEIADLLEAIEIVQANIESGRYDKAEQEETLHRHRARLNELMMLKTSPDEIERAFGHVAVIVIVLALIAVFFAGGLAGYSLADGERDAADYREKVNFCHDRMKNDKIRYIWRQQYCGKVKVDAVDPVTGKPVAGIVEGE